MNARTGLEQWHAYIDSGCNVGQLQSLVADGAVFHSPVTHTPQAGKAKVVSYLLAAARVFENGGFRYVREMVDGDDVLLEFAAEIDDIQINGVDLIRFDANGQITDFKVMLRPLKAVNKMWEMMAAQLGEAAQKAAQPVG